MFNKFSSPLVQFGALQYLIEHSSNYQVLYPSNNAHWWILCSPLIDFAYNWKNVSESSKRFCHIQLVQYGSNEYSMLQFYALDVQHACIKL